MTDAFTDAVESVTFSATSPTRITCAKQEDGLRMWDFKEEPEMTIVVKEVGKRPEVREIEGTLKEMQAIVDGNIEAIYLPDGLVMVCDEEGKIKDKTGNFRFGWDYIVGDVFFVGAGEEDFVSLTDEQVELVKGFFL